MTAERPARTTTVLVVDDSPETIGLIVSVLEERGVMVLVALDGEKAIGIAHRTMPDIILMDAVMPGLDGFETCRRLKAQDALSHIPVIFMTGLSETEHIVRAFSVGGVDYVTKPIVVEEVMARMRVHQQNARKNRSVQLALDTAGRFLLAADRSGAVLWATPQARQLLSVTEAGAERDADRIGLDPSTLVRGAACDHPHDRSLVVTLVGELGPNEFLLRLGAKRCENDESEALQTVFGLTAREAEVLLWLARGKANRDIADILDLSPRTVDKHLETVFRKLGVENRTATAAYALRLNLTNTKF